MLTHVSPNKVSYNYNSDSDDMTINRFDRIACLHRARFDHLRDELLHTANKNQHLQAFPKSARKYRYHSVVSISIENIISPKDNVRFLRKLKRKYENNTDFLLSDCLEVYDTLCEGLQKEVVYGLIGLIIQLKETDVVRLRDSDCEKIFRRIQHLTSEMSYLKRGRMSSIEYQYNELASGSGGKNGHDKLVRQIKFLLARFEFNIAALGHFIHYNHIEIANTPKKTNARSINLKSVNSILSSIFTTMETKAGKDSYEMPKIKIINSDSKDSSRKETMEGPPKKQKSDKETSEGSEYKFGQVKSYFRWKLEKWRDQDLEEIVLVCRICSKSMSAKIMKKHSPLCKKVFEEEKTLKEFGKKMSNIIEAATKEKQKVIVELRIEKRQLTTLQAQKLKKHGDGEDLDESFDMALIGSPVLITGPVHDHEERHSIFWQQQQQRQQQSQSISEERRKLDKVHSLREGLKVLDVKAHQMPDVEVVETKKPRIAKFEIPLLVLPEPAFEKGMSDSESCVNTIIQNTADYLKIKNEPITQNLKSSDRKSRKEGNSGQGSYRSKSQKKVDEQLRNEQQRLSDCEDSYKEEIIMSSPRFSKQTETHGRKSLFHSATTQFSISPLQNLLVEKDDSTSTIDQTPHQPQQKLVKKMAGKSASNHTTPVINRHFDKRNTNFQTSHINQVENEMLQTLRKRLERIKELKVLVKGYEILLHYANLTDNFNEYDSETRVIVEEGRAEVAGFMSKIKNSPKFTKYSADFLTLIMDKLERMKMIDISKREIKAFEHSSGDANDTTKELSNIDVAQVSKAKTSWDSSEFVSTLELSPEISPNRAATLQNRLDTKLSITTAQSPMSPNNSSPLLRRSRKIRPRSVEKSSSNHRYEKFDKNLQQMIKRIKKDKKGSPTAHKGKSSSKLLRNSVFNWAFQEDLVQDMHSEKNLMGERRSSLMRLNNIKNEPAISSIQEKIESESESKDDSACDSNTNNNIISTSDVDTDSKTRLTKDRLFDLEQTEKQCFSDDESNIKRCARNQEKGLSSIITIEDFEFIKLINKGAYGKVWLVRRKITGDYYAMKIINFADRKNLNQIDSLKKEKKVFEVLKGDFVVKAIFTFVHQNYLCIVMEVMIGGDFGNVLEKFGALEEDVAKFYIAEIVVALKSLHQLGIVHRDLKPDNILLNKDGHIKLTDFGLSEVGIQKQKIVNNLGKRCSNMNIASSPRGRGSNTEKSLSSFSSFLAVAPATTNEKNSGSIILANGCGTILEVEEEGSLMANSTKGNRIIGTPDYMAPEIIKGTCYDDPCIDWWSVGVILFELIVGIPPFNDDDIETVFSNIVKRKIPWDELQIGYDEGSVTPEAQSLINGLLELDRTKRLGAKGVDEIMNHPFFKGINWSEILKSKGPIVPVIENDIDVSNFHKETRKFLEAELESPFFDKSPVGSPAVNINKETFEFTRLDILHEENQKVVEEAKNTISQEELERMRKERLVNRKWSVFD